MHVLPVPRDLPIERRPLTTPIRVEVVSFDFGNTLVRVDRAASRAVLEATAVSLAEARTITDAAAFKAVWAEERDRQFREEVPEFREVDLDQRVVRVLARLRGLAAPASDGRWDDATAVPYSKASEVAAAVDAYSAAFVATMPPLPDSAGVLERLHARGFRLAILSNWPHAATIDRYVEAQGWAPLLEAVLVSQRLGTIKPHPDIFRLAAAELDVVPERIIQVGDDWTADVMGAAKAGWRTAYLRGRQGDTPLPTSKPDDGAEADLGIAELPELERHRERWGP